MKQVNEKRRELIKKAYKVPVLMAIGSLTRANAKQGSTVDCTKYPNKKECKQIW